MQVKKMISMTEETIKIAEEKAKQLGLSLSAYIRFLIMKGGN